MSDHPGQQFIVGLTLLKMAERLLWAMKGLEEPVEIQEKITEKLQIIIQTERKITTREMTKRLNVSKGTLDTLLKENGIRKLCSRFVHDF